MDSALIGDKQWKSARAIALGGFLCYLLFFSQLGALGLVGPDEPRYAQVAREMAEQHDWITPKLYGSPWFEKPILYYWLAAIAYRIGGVNEAMARLPSALGASATVVVFAALAWELYSWTAAQLTFLMLAGALGWVGFARAASMDMVFSASLNLALACLVMLVSAQDETTRARSAGGFAVALGLAMLAKGPAALVLAGGTILLYALLTSDRGILGRLLRPAPVALFLLTAVPWYALVARVNGWEFIRTFFLAHNVERFLTPVFHHERGPWFFFVVLPLLIFPWSLLLGAIFRRLWQERSRLRLAPSAELMLVLWIAIPLVFFTLSRSKLPGYILPAVPALCLLVAREMTLFRANSSLRGWLLASSVSAIAVAAASPWILQQISLPITDARAYRVELAVVLLGLCGIGWLAWRRQVLAWAFALTMLVALAVNATNYFLAGEINRYFSARPIARQILAQAPATVPTLYTFQVSRQLTYGLNFYVGHALPDAETELGLTEPAYLLLPAASLRQAQQQTGRRLEVVSQLEGNWIVVRAATAPRVAAPSGRN